MQRLHEFDRFANCVNCNDKLENTDKYCRFNDDEILSKEFMSWNVFSVLPDAIMYIAKRADDSIHSIVIRNGRISTRSRLS